MDAPSPPLAAVVSLYAHLWGFKIKTETLPFGTVLAVIRGADDPVALAELLQRVPWPGRVVVYEWHGKAAWPRAYRNACREDWEAAMRTHHPVPAGEDLLPPRTADAVALATYQGARVDVSGSANPLEVYLTFDAEPCSEMIDTLHQGCFVPLENAPLAWVYVEAQRPRPALRLVSGSAVSTESETRPLV
ncbi:MAG: hypothetical protein JNK72_24560 [Myxococcales bacterium]|nr:hypothetical protein [Myxococcales bacterium]